MTPVSLMRGEPWLLWGTQVLLGLLYIRVAVNVWRVPAFEISAEGVRWPRSRLVEWSALKPLTLPPDDGWKHTVYLDTQDGRQVALPRMPRAQLEGLAARIRAGQGNRED